MPEGPGGTPSVPQYEIGQGRPPVYVPVTPTRRPPASASLHDVVELILDRGLVIDAYVRVSLVGVELLTIDARVVIASVDTYLRFAEAANRLDLRGRSEAMGLPEIGKHAASPTRVAQSAASDAADTVSEHATSSTHAIKDGIGAVGHAVSDTVRRTREALHGAEDEGETPRESPGGPEAAPDSRDEKTTKRERPGGR